MRHRLPPRGVLLLVVALGLIGLAGCSRQAQVRDSQPAEPASTEAILAAPEGESVSPAPGETVVSAVSPEPAVSESPTAEPPTSQPAVADSPTAESVSPAQPTASPTATTAELPPTQSPTSGEAGQTIVHTVKKGETLSDIAERYGTTSQAIAEANEISDPSTIFSGQELKIPTSGDSSGESSSSQSGDGDSSDCRLRHRVKKGEWVWQIARRYGADPQKVMKANNLTSRKAKTLQPGTMLCIP